MLTFREALDAAKSRPSATAKREVKKNYAESLSRQLATCIAGRLRSWFPGVTPEKDGTKQEAQARTAKGFKKLDVNYSTPQLGLALGVSIKTINFVDAKTGRYTKNYTRVDNELRAEALDYHVRQPYAVLVGVLFLPADACTPSSQGPNATSSFGAAVQTLRRRAGRQDPTDAAELFERFFVALYEHEGPKRGDVCFFDVMNAPPRNRPLLPEESMSFERFIQEIVETYNARNDPPFEWATDPE